MLISVVMPTYNQAHFLPEALDSVFAQTYRDFELIVVNDGSTDSTADILDEYQRTYTFSVINQENRRLPASLNTGFAEAKGDYLTWTSSDNLMLPNMLTTLASVLDAEKALGLAYADRYFMDDDGVDLGVFPLPEYDRYLILHINMVHCCFLYRRECMERVGSYDDTFIFGEDWEYWTRISQFYKMKRIPHPLYRYRLHRQSMTSDLVRGEARTIGYAAMSNMLRHRWPLRWWLGKMKLYWIKKYAKSHPAVKDMEIWRRTAALAARQPWESEG